MSTTSIAPTGTIAVTGATGQLGRLVTERLKARLPAAQVVALVRSPEKASDLGVSTRRFDYSETDTLQPALAGVDTLLLVSGNELGQRTVQHRNVIAAAKAAGVARIVYTSLLRADTSPLSLAAEHLATENLLKASGIAYTLLRNGWYTENYTASFPGALASGALIGCAGDGQISSATRADYADAAVVTLTGSGHEDKTYELAGDDAYMLTELAGELSRQVGRDIPYQNLSEADYAAALTRFGVPEDFAKALAGWNIDAAGGALFSDDRTLSTLIGRPTTPLATAVSDALGQNS